MADIELVIKIPEEVYKNIQSKSTEIQAEGYIVENAILNGIPLPKGHGDLIDRKELLDTFWTYCRGGDFGYHQAEDLIKSKLAIIEADRAESEKV